MTRMTVVERLETDFESGSVLPCLAVVVVATLYVAVILQADSQLTIIGLLVGGGLAVFAAARLDWISVARHSYRAHERTADTCAVLSVIALALLFHNDHFVLLLIVTVLVYVVACLGLNLQFGYAGMLNFAGAAMLGVGGYTAAVLSQIPSVPTLLVLPAGGLVAATIGCVLLLPMLRTYGHYNAVVTIAFSLLFVTFLEVNGGLGGAQGLPVQPGHLFGWPLNNNWEFAGFHVAFYVNYLAVALVLTVLVVGTVRRIERSWIGLNLDAVRCDEAVSKCFGINIALWKTVAFTAGNFIIGLAGAFFAMLQGYIAPSNFTFSDSLIPITIILLGGLGSIWGVILATIIVIVLPEKLQAIQEYRFLLYAIVVTLVLLYRPDGLIPRAARTYFRGWKP